MIFSYENVQKILTHRKIQTRRKVGEPGEECRYKVGRTYALQPGRGKDGLGPRILITHVRREPLGAILEKEARAEGYTSREEFFEDFYKLSRLRNDGDYCSDEREVWVIEFRLVEEADQASPDYGGEERNGD